MVRADRFLTYSLRDPRVANILAAALDAVEPGKIVRQYLENTVLPAHQRLFLLGLGKAAEPMTLAAAEILGGFADALIITKRASSSTHRHITVMEGGHPIPDERSLAAGRAILKFISHLRESDLLICLISGGGSALAAAPSASASLADIGAMTAALLASGANVQDINVLRRQLDILKGGGLAQSTKAGVLSLILSDVVGDHLEAIASGPTVANPTAGDDALAILRKYGVENHIPQRILTALHEKPAFEQSAFERAQNVIVGNNRLAAEAAIQGARAAGFHAEILTTEMQGEARLMGKQLAERLKIARRENAHPFCLIEGGETTVTLRGDGKGGRNQELALAAVNLLDGVPHAMLIALATDGDDGPTDAAGAVVTGETKQRAAQREMAADDYLSRNDAYPFFETLGDLLRPGYTGTNVNDLIFLFGL